MCRCPPRGILYKRRERERFYAHINIELSSEDRTWDITSIEMGSVGLTHKDKELLKAASVMVVVFMLKTLLRCFTTEYIMARKKVTMEWTSTQ